jgi:hypothetical protein
VSIFIKSQKSHQNHEFYFSKSEIILLNFDKHSNDNYLSINPTFYKKTISNFNTITNLTIHYKHEDKDVLANDEQNEIKLFLENLQCDNVEKCYSIICEVLTKIIFTTFDSNLNEIEIDFNEIIEKYDHLISLPSEFSNDDIEKIQSIATPQQLEKIDISYTVSTLSRFKEELLKLISKTDASEEEFQLLLKVDAKIFSLIFNSPVIFFSDKAYIGGKTLENKHGKIVDYLFNNSLTNDAIIIEIKRANENFLTNEYRDGIYKISPEISGAINQLLKYRLEYVQNFNHALCTYGQNGGDTSLHPNAYSPKCILISGKISELDSPNKKQSFSLFKNSLKDLEIITYDEIIQKIITLIEILKGKIE